MHRIATPLARMSHEQSHGRTGRPSALDRLRLRGGVRFDAEPIVHGAPELLFASEVPLRRLEETWPKRKRIDYSDIPESSPEQLEAMRRVGRPPLGDEPRRLIAIRVDPSVLESFRKEARRRHVGYQTLINEVLAEHLRKDVA